MCSNNYVGGISGYNPSKIVNCYNIGAVSGTYRGYIMCNSSRSSAALNKCYYLKLEQNLYAVGDTSEDDTTKVTAVTDVSEITAAILNSNIDSIEHEEEWTRWVDGPNGYPVFK